MSDEKYTPEQCLTEIQAIIDMASNTRNSPQEIVDVLWPLVGKLFRMVEFLYHHGTYK